MRAEFYRPEAPEEPIGSAAWTGGTTGVRIAARTEDDRRVLEYVFRPTPVVDDDPSLRVFGTTGPATLQPGTFRWFEAVARIRGLSRGLDVRLIADEERRAMGW